MMKDRIELGAILLAKTGVCKPAINDTETHSLRAILDNLFVESNRMATIVAEVNPAGQNLRPNAPALSHDYFTFMQSTLAKLGCGKTSNER